MEKAKDIKQKIEGFEKMRDRIKIMFADLVLAKMHDLPEDQYIQWINQRTNAAMSHRIQELEFIDQQIIDLEDQLESLA